jgi:hypothetical protein
LWNEADYDDLVRFQSKTTERIPTTTADRAAVVAMNLALISDPREAVRSLH